MSPDGSRPSAFRTAVAVTPLPAAVSPPVLAAPRRWVSPMTRRILLVNVVPLVLLVGTLLYLNQFQNSLLEAEVSALREQARIYAGALGQAAVQGAPPRAATGRAPAEHPPAGRTGPGGPPGSPSGSPSGTRPRTAPGFVLAGDLARPLLLRLTEPSPSARARLFAPDGQLVADSRAEDPEPAAADASDAAEREGGRDPGPVPGDGASASPTLSGLMERAYDRVLVLLPHRIAPVTLPQGADPDAQPAVREQLRLGDADSSETAPFIRRTADHRLLVTVAEPVAHDGQTVGIIQLTREARQVDSSLFAVRSSILVLFGVALLLTVLLSWYLAQTISRPLLRLAASAHVMRETIGRTGSVPARLLARRDELGELAVALEESARALWARMDAIERFAADVSHEIKNPLSSIRSAIETLMRIADPEPRARLLSIINEDVRRLDRLITDISDASRVDAELSRSTTEPVEVVPMLDVLAELNQATRKPDGPHLLVEAPAVPLRPLVVEAVEDRLVQVLRNLIGNAASFSPPNGTITLAVADRPEFGVAGGVEIAVSDQGPGIPAAKLDSIFDRFYSERPPSERFGQHSGLGLSISRQIVEALRGRISAENRVDARGRVLGARFVVVLPRAIAAHPMRAATGAPAGPARAA
ncbi:MAG: sensor N-terminal transmembrane domain-containing protein [Gluconacetobacter diazotrophicus]|nr:sensor N-terminal transmembrane domain-containing protein [Gluconacetobacter diazotrophicus]